VSDYSLVAVDHQPDFDNISLVPVEHDPFSADGVTPQAQSQQAQPQPAQPQPQQSAAVVSRLYVGRPANNPQASEVDESWNPMPKKKMFQTNRPHRHKTGPPMTGRASISRSAN
jgi:hypothetical protein